MAIKIKKIIILIFIGLFLSANQSLALFGSKPKPGKTMDQTEQRYGFDRNILRRGKQKTDFPTAEIHFDKTDPKEGEKVTASAYGMWFTNLAEDLYYTWYIIHKGDDPTDPLTIERGKREAMGLVARGDYDPFLFGETYDTEEDDDGYKASFGGHDGVGGKEGDGFDGIGDYEYQHWADKARGLVDTEAITRCYRHNVHTGHDRIVECKHKFATAPTPDNEPDPSRRVFEGTVLEEGGERPYLLSCRGDHEVGDGEFGIEEEECWRLNPKSSDTDGDGFSDEADLAGLGQKSLTWTYQEGDQVGVIIEGTSMVATNEGKKPVLPKNLFSGHFQTRDEFEAQNDYNPSDTDSSAAFIDGSFIGGGFVNKTTLISCLGGGQAMTVGSLIDCIDSAGDVTDWGGVIDEDEYRRGDVLGLDLELMRTENVPDDVYNDPNYYEIIGLIDGNGLLSDAYPHYDLTYEELIDALTKNLNSFMDDEDERYKLDGPEVVDALSGFPNFYDGSEQLSEPEAAALASSLNALKENNNFNDTTVGVELELAGVYDPTDQEEEDLLGVVVDELNVFLEGTTNLSSTGERLVLSNLPNEINDLWLGGTYSDNSVGTLLEEYGIYEPHKPDADNPSEEADQLSLAVDEIELFLTGTNLEGSTRRLIEPLFQGFVNDNVLLADDFNKDPRVSEHRIGEEVADWRAVDAAKKDNAYYKIMWAGSDICREEVADNLEADECDDEDEDKGFTYLATRPVYQQSEKTLKAEITISPEEPTLNTQVPIFSDRILASAQLENVEEDKRFIYYDWELFLCDDDRGLTACGEAGAGILLTAGCGDGESIGECAGANLNSETSSSGMGVDWISFQPTESFINNLNSDKPYLKIVLKTKKSETDNKMALSSRIIPLKKNNLGIELYETNRIDSSGQYFFDDDDDICNNPSESSGIICPVYPYQTIAAKAKIDIDDPSSINGYYWEVNGKRISSPQVCSFDGGCDLNDVVYLPIIDNGGEEQIISLSIQVEENGLTRNLTSERSLLVKNPMALIKSEDANAWVTEESSPNIFYTETGNRVEFRADLVQYYLDVNSVDFTWFINNREIDNSFISENPDLNLSLDEDSISFDVPTGFSSYSLKVKTTKEVADSTKEDMKEIWGINVFEDSVSEEGSVLLKKSIEQPTAENSTTSIKMFLASTINNAPQYLLFSLKTATVMIVAWFLIFGLSFLEKPLRIEKK